MTEEGFLNLLDQAHDSAMDSAPHAPVTQTGQDIRLSGYVNGTHITGSDIAAEAYGKMIERSARLCIAEQRRCTRNCGVCKYDLHPLGLDDEMIRAVTNKVQIDGDMTTRGLKIFFGFMFVMLAIALAFGLWISKDDVADPHLQIEQRVRDYYGSKDKPLAGPIGELQWYDADKSGSITCVDWAYIYKEAHEKRYGKGEARYIEYHSHRQGYGVYPNDVCHVFVQIWDKDKWVYYDPKSGAYGDAIFSVRFPGGYIDRNKITDNKHCWQYAEIIYKSWWGGRDY